MNNQERQALIEHAQNWIKDAEETRDEIPFGFDEDTEKELSLMKIALVALTAEPVTWWTGPEPTSTGEIESFHDHETGSHEYPLVCLIALRKHSDIT